MVWHWVRRLVPHIGYLPALSSAVDAPSGDAAQRRAAFEHPVPFKLELRSGLNACRPTNIFQWARILFLPPVVYSPIQNVLANAVRVCAIKPIRHDTVRVKRIEWLPERGPCSNYTDLHNSLPFTTLHHHASLHLLRLPSHIDPARLNHSDHIT